MAQIQKGTTYSTGDQVTATNLNALADAAILLPGAITDQTAKTVPLAADTVLIHSAADTALRKSTLTQLFANATGIPISTGVSGLGTGIATALAVNTGSAGAPVLFNGALGTPTSGTVTNLTGTASININGTVGATTASTGAFTTLSASTSATVRSGVTGLVIRDYTAGSLVSLYSTNVTASNTNYSLSFDGVDTYLNGATSARLVAAGTTVASATSAGLAVTGALSSTTGANFATSSGSVGVGTASPTSQLSVVTTTNNLLSLTKTATVALNVTAASSPTGIDISANGGNVLTLNTGSNNGNVGIGTTSPAFPLDVNLGLVVRGNATRSGSGMFLANDSTYGLSINAVNHLVAGLPLAIMGYPIKFLSSETGGELARIDTSGNVGIGTATPSEKLTVYSATDTYATVRSASQVLAFNAGTGFIGSAATSIYNTSAIPMIFGTNNAERARIDSSGNFMVGIASSSHRLHAEVASGADRDMFMTSVAGASNGFRVQWNNSTSKIHVNIQNLPTSSAGLSAGTLYVVAGALMVA